MSKYANSAAALIGVLCVFMSIWIFYATLKNQEASSSSQEIINVFQQELTWYSASLFAEHTRFLEQLEYAENTGSPKSYADLADRFDIYWSRYDLLAPDNSVSQKRLIGLLKNEPEKITRLNSFFAHIRSIKTDGLEVLASVEHDVMTYEAGDKRQYSIIYQKVSQLTGRLYQVQLEAHSFFRQLIEYRISSYRKLHRRIGTLSTILLFTALTGFILLLRYHILRQRVTHELRGLNSKLKKEIKSSNKLALRLDKQAHHDVLSGLLNRLGINREVENTYASSDCVGVCFIDLDMFKIVNDTSGHAAGDELIRQIAKILTGLIPDGLHLARYGGDEFLLYWPNCSQNEFEAAVSEISSALSPFVFEYANKQFEISASMGAVYLNTESLSFDDVFIRADAACHESKRLGGARVKFHDDMRYEFKARATDFDCIALIQRSLSEEKFQLFYQPINVLKDESWAPYSWELLIRMVDLEGNLISPALFLDVAEKYGFAARIDKWVVESAIDWLEQNDLEGFNLTCLNINLSGLSLSDNEFIEHIGEKLTSSTVDPASICFEVTETSIIAEGARSNLEKLKSFGIRLALDDFGSGFASFGYLESLPVDCLKIDGSFVRDIDSNTTHYAFVDAITAVGKAMKIQVTAEFVENQESLEKLVAIGVDFVQGYYFGKPEPLSSLSNSTDINRAA